MNTLPAICEHCGTIFFSNAIAVGEGARVTSQGNTVGPCPGCGHRFARIPDGTYETVRGTLRMLLRDPASAQSLKGLARILQSAWDVQADQAVVADRIEAEAPESADFAQSLRTLNSLDWRWWLLFLLTFIQTLASVEVIGPKPETISDQQIERIMRQVLQEQPTATTTSAGTAKAKPGRNDPCPCGSGKKYKRCHLVPAP
jgi:hypothetical protein